MLGEDGKAGLAGRGVPGASHYCGIEDASVELLHDAHPDESPDPEGALRRLFASAEAAVDGVLVGAPVRG